MQKISTPLIKTDLENAETQNQNCEMSMQPSDQSIRKILQFAANYRVQKIQNNQYVEMMLS
jgi:hypothetical protein